MARKKGNRHENHERWLVSYADLVTLLFAFFVVMFASTQTDHSRAKEISEAVDRALRHGALPPKVAAILGGTVDDRGRGNAMLRGPAVIPPQKKHPDEAPRLLDLASSIKTLRQELGAEIGRGAVEIHVEQRGVIVGLNAATFFPSGGDTIDESVYPTIGKVAAVLNRLPNALRLEGHTDSIPISNARFRSNWELSAARSIAMLRLLSERFGVERERLAIVGYADTYSVGSNQTEEGRRKNRRVDIVIVSDYGMRAEPGQSGASRDSALGDASVGIQPLAENTKTAVTVVGKNNSTAGAKIP